MQAGNFIFERARPIIILQRALPLEKTLSLRETFEGAPRPRPEETEDGHLWNSRPADDKHGINALLWGKRIQSFA